MRGTGWDSDEWGMDNQNGNAKRNKYIPSRHPTNSFVGGERERNGQEKGKYKKKENESHRGECPRLKSWGLNAVLGGINDV